MWILAVVTVWLFIMGVCDIRKRRVPVWMLVIGGCLAAVAALQSESDFADILRGMLPGVVLLMIALTTKKVGYGDGIVLITLGIVLGDGRCVLLFAMGLFLICIFSLVLLVLRKVGRNTGIPFLPFLAAAWVIVIRA